MKAYSQFDPWSCLSSRYHRRWRKEWSREAWCQLGPESIDNSLEFPWSWPSTCVLAHYRHRYKWQAWSFSWMFFETRTASHGLQGDGQCLGSHQNSWSPFRRLWQARPLLIQIYQDDSHCVWWPWAPVLYAVWFQMAPGRSWERNPASPIAYHSQVLPTLHFCQSFRI